MEMYEGMDLTFSKPVGIPAKRRVPRYTPAVIALLATTSIPPPKKSSQNRRHQSSYYATSTEAEVEVEDDDSAALFPSPPLEALLSSSDEDLFSSTEMARSDSDGLLSVRSASTESVPSLETDTESIVSSSSWTKKIYRRRVSRTRVAVGVKCILHPLSPERPVEDCVVNDAAASQKRVMRKLNFVSNLTASLKVLKSAAKSLSNMTAAAAQPDYILSISPRLTDERRPALQKDEPTPALRRYLNPYTPPRDEMPCTGAVQMQTYRKTSSGRSKSGRTARANERPVPEPTVRQREVRENSDFLRVIVLEMNMRRSGKLSETTLGRARHSLPPRQASKITTIGDASRWESWVV